MDIEESGNKCAVCFECNNPETMVKCQQCSLTVHLKCYGCSTKSFSIWKCRYCIYTEEQNIDARPDNYSILCRICNQKTYGALKPCANNDGFAHLICALWTPFTFVRNEYHYSPIHNIQKCKEYKHILDKLNCSICFKSHATIKCRIKSCNEYFHPLCLMGKQVELKQNKCMIKQDLSIGKMSATMYYVYCPNHAHLHKTCDASLIMRIDRQAILKTLPIQQPNIQTPPTQSMCVDENKTNYNQHISTPFSYKNNMFNDNESVFNPFGRESSAFSNHMNNNYMFNTFSPQPMASDCSPQNTVDMDANMDDIGMVSEITSQTQLFRSNATTPSTMSGISSFSRSRVPSLTYNRHQINDNDLNMSYFL